MDVVPYLNVFHGKCQTHQDKGNGNDILVDVPKYRNCIKYERVARTPLGDVCPLHVYPRMILTDHIIVLWQVLFTTWQDLSQCTISKYKISVMLSSFLVSCGLSHFHFEIWHELLRLCQLQYSLWNKSCCLPTLSGQCFQTSLWFCWTPWCPLADTPAKTCQILWRDSWKKIYESSKCCDTLNIDI